MSTIVTIVLATDEDFIDTAIILLFVGPIVAWISSWLLYGFGELIDKVCDIERNTRIVDGQTEVQFKCDSERISKLEKLHSQGLITDEEYKRAISKER